MTEAGSVRAHLRVVGEALVALALGWMMIYATTVRDWLGVALAGGFLAALLTFVTADVGRLVAQRRERSEPPKS